MCVCVGGGLHVWMAMFNYFNPLPSQPLPSLPPYELLNGNEVLGKGYSGGVANAGQREVEAHHL